MADRWHEKTIEEVDLKAMGDWDALLDECERGQLWIIAREGREVAALIPYRRISDYPATDHPRHKCVVPEAVSGDN